MLFNSFMVLKVKEHAEFSFPDVVSKRNFLLV